MKDGKILSPHYAFNLRILLRAQMLFDNFIIDVFDISRYKYPDCLFEEAIIVCNY
jgi:hypothetical protein